MNISVFGLGYVGTVTAACLARDGNTVIGVDVSPAKLELLASGKSTVVEPGLEELLSEYVKQGRIKTTGNAFEAAAASELSLISVGTPPDAQGGPNLHYVFTVCREIGKAVREKGEPHVVILRSTVPPGTLERCRDILEEEAGETPVHVAFNPEFLREGSAIKDYDAPPYTIIGTEDPIAEKAVRDIYAGLEAPFVVVKPAVAEMVKYVANTWHAAKIAFANEVGRVAKGFGVDGREVMNIITQDTKLNVSPAYMKPGFAYGGSCLPKDLGALIHYAHEQHASVPMLEAIPTSNQTMVELAGEAALSVEAEQVTMLGLAFKPKTDDLRESPAVPLVKRLLGEGREVTIYDQAVYQANLMGANLSFIQQNLPHFEALLTDSLENALSRAELVIVTHATDEFRQALADAPAGTKVLDLAGLFEEVPEHLEYRALCWEDRTKEVRSELVA